VTSPEQSDLVKIGRVYTGPYGWKFRIDVITTHPDPADGEPMVLGWKFFNGYWQAASYGLSEWLGMEDHEWLPEETP
jgi:hypothetical protein